MEEILFLEIKEEHLQDVMEIYNYFVLHTTVSFDLEALTIEQIKSNVMNSNPRYKSYVIIQDRVIKGYVLITQHKNKHGYDRTGEVTIYLKPEFIGQGLGRKALYFIEEKAKELGFFVLIATICKENERSIYLFESNGYIQAAHFKEVGYKFGRSLDIVSYQKMIQ